MTKLYEVDSKRSFEPRKIFLMVCVETNESFFMQAYRPPVVTKNYKTVGCWHIRPRFKQIVVY